MTRANAPSNAIRFWGVRGSIASPGSHTTGVGGNTSCVEICLAGERILLDGGTGLRALGQARGPAPLEATLLFGHLHWDHIQGVPFFGPLFHPQSRLRLVGPAGLEAALRGQMSGPVFPVSMEAFNAGLTLENVAPGARLQVGEVTVTTTALDHPGGCIGYRLEHAGHAVVYAVDHEQRGVTLDPALVDLAAGAEVLIHDAQYLPEEQAGKVGWGHSTYVQAVQLAVAAGVQTLVLTHHDPTRDDVAVLQIEQRARQLFPGTWAAREGLTLELCGPWQGQADQTFPLAAAV